MAKVEKIGMVTTASVLKCTGRGWDEWIAILDKNGARHWDHRQIVAFLKNRYKLGPWWEQGVATGFEMHIGKKVEGRNAKGEYAMTVSKTFPMNQKDLWKFLGRPEALAIWMKNLAPVQIRQGFEFETEDGFFGKIRTMKAPDRMRLSWQDSEWEKHSILQLMLLKRPGEKSVLVFQHEKLKDGRLRLQMKEHWKQVLSQLSKLAQRE